MFPIQFCLFYSWKIGNARELTEIVKVCDVDANFNESKWNWAESVFACSGLSICPSWCWFVANEWNDIIWLKGKSSKYFWGLWVLLFQTIFWLSHSHIRLGCPSSLMVVICLPQSFSSVQLSNIISVFLFDLCLACVFIIHWDGSLSKFMLYAANDEPWSCNNVCKVSVCVFLPV